MKPEPSIPVHVNIITATSKLERRRDDARDSKADARMLYLAGMLLFVLSSRTDGWWAVLPVVAAVVTWGGAWWIWRSAGRFIRDLDKWIDQDEAR